MWNGFKFFKAKFNAYRVDFFTSIFIGGLSLNSGLAKFDLLPFLIIGQQFLFSQKKIKVNIA